ncbi:hypothetical protein ACHAXR_009352 [Thalassiosira sp. AJA248-18]
MDSPGDPKERLISLAEWIALSASLENHQANGSRRTAQLAYIGRAAIVALLLLDKLLDYESCDTGESCTFCALPAHHVVVENFSLKISADTEDLKNSPELLLSALESISDAQIPEPLCANNDGQSLPEILRRLGSLLYQIFSRGKPHIGGAENESKPDTKPRRGGGLGNGADEELPGAQKGRQKRSITDTCKSFRRVQISDVEDALSELCVPESIATLLKDLIEPEGCEFAFQSLGEVSGELRQIIDQPNLFLFGEDTAEKGVLNFGGNIIGRTEEVRSLLHAAATTTMAGGDPSHPKSLVLIGGEAGSGKSYLVESVHGSLTESGWIYLSCKFDRLLQAQQLSTIASAFENFFQHVASVAYEGGDVEDIVSSVLDNLSASGVVVMSELIPSLCALYPSVFASIVEDDVSDSSDEDNNSQNSHETIEQNLDDSTMNLSSAGTLKNRIYYLFRRLLHAISSPEHPVFLWVDDMQWMDESSIELLSSLLTDSDHLSNDNRGACLLVVGSYRSSEVDDSHILTPYISRFQQSALVSVQKIDLHEFTRSHANALVSEALRLPVRRTRGLTDVLHNKTLGNPLFLTQTMKSLVDEKSISYSLVKKRWVWDVSKVKATSIDDSVANLMTRKLMRLPEDTQKALKLASCFGLRVGESSLRILLAYEEFRDIFSHLNNAQQEGILEWDGQCYRFAHDMIQQAAYELMTPEERGKQHFSIGIQLVTHLNLSSSTDSCIFNPVSFTAADQINIAKSSAFAEDPLGEQSMHIEFASLNLRAGERSMEVSDFASALNYLENGMSFLPETRWDTQYELSLRLYDSSCLACYINARYDKMTQFLQEILENAESFDDKLNGFFVLVQSLASSGKIKESIEKVFYIVDELGESFPDESEVTPAAIQDALMSTKNELEGYSKEDLICAPRLKDKRLHWVVKLLAYVTPYLYIAKPTHLSLVASRIVNISSKHGFCSESAFGICSYSYLLITILSDIDKGYRWGKICLAMIEKLGAKRIVPKLRVLLYQMVLFWVEPLPSTSVALLQCHHDALLVGDVEYASFGALFYCAQNIFCGVNSLPVIEKECAGFALKMISLNQLLLCLTHLATQIFVLRLMGSDKDPFEVLGGFVKNEDELLHHALSTRRLPLALRICCNRALVAFFFKRYDEAAEYAGKCKNELSTPMCFAKPSHSFYEGLTYFHFVRCQVEDLGKQKEWIEIGEKNLSLFRTWSKHSTWNWENKLLLLEAEWYFSRGEMDTAEEKYRAAIKSARQHRFVHEEGLSNELFSAFHNTIGNFDKTKSHIAEARACYEKWGAFALVELLDSSEN